MFSLTSDFILMGLVQSLMLAFVTIGVMIPFRLLDLPDLSSEGAYPLGGILCAAMLSLGMHPALAILIAVIAGGCLGMGTAFIHLKLKLHTLLAGIILSTMVYSVNLRLMGKPNLALFNEEVIFQSFEGHVLGVTLSLLLLNLLLIYGLHLYFKTEKGLRFRAVGFNKIFAEKQGIRLSSYIYFGFFVASAFSAFGGALMVQYQRYADIGMGVGIVIHALAAMMIGEALIGTKTITRQILACFVGAVIYQQIQGLVISLGVDPSDMKLMTGAIVLLAISLKRFKKA